MYTTNKTYNKRTKLTKVSRTPNKTTPQLRISGRWLKDNGFNEEEIVDIIVREELLIIQPISRA